MYRSVTCRRYRLLQVCVLAIVFLAGCSQSIPSSGESIDAISGRSEGRRGVKESTGEGYVSSPEDMSGERMEGYLEQMADASNPQRMESGGVSVISDEDRIDHGESRNTSEAAARAYPEESRTAYADKLLEEDFSAPPDGETLAGEKEGTSVAASNSNKDATSDQLDRLDVSAPEPDLPTGGTGLKIGHSPVQAAKSDAAREEETAEKQSGDNQLTFRELYASVGVRGITLSEKVQALTGQEVEMNGYMAPPLTAGVRFFVLTKTLMAVCPFCSTDADWPTDIVVVYLPDGEELQPTEHPVKVTGKLDTGSYTDEDTGFVSLVRIYADKVEVIR